MRKGDHTARLRTNFGNWLATQLIWLGWGYQYEDLGPLRLIRRSAIDQLHMADRGFGWTVEMQAKSAEQKLRVCELPVNYFPRQGGRSKISGTVLGSLRAGQVILLTLAKLYGQKLMQQYRQPRNQRMLRWAIALLMVFGSAIATPHGDFLNQPEAVPLFWRGMSLMGLGFVLAWGLGQISSGWFWLLAILPRLVMLAMYPGDDIWRYLWEGYIQNLGFNPYLVPPDADVLAPFRFTWWIEINHPDLAAVYPPIAQLWFRLLARDRAVRLTVQVNLCRCRSRHLLAAEPSIWPSSDAKLCLESAGDLQLRWRRALRQFVLLPLVTAWLLSSGSEPSSSEPSSANQSLNRARAGLVRYRLGSVLAVKWMSLPVLVLFASHRRWLGWWRGPLLLVLGLVPLAIATLPFCDGTGCPVIPLSSPFVNYGRSAALVPQLVGDIWPASTRMNWIYTLPLVGVVLWGLLRSLPVDKFTERYFIALMLLSPVIHAWYFTWLMPFGVASRNWGTRLVSRLPLVHSPYRMG